MDFKIGMGPASASAPSDPNSAFEKSLMRVPVDGVNIQPSFWFEANDGNWIQNSKLIDRARGDPMVPISGYGFPAFAQRGGYYCLNMPDGSDALQVGGFPVAEFTLVFAMYVDAASPTSAQTQPLGGTTASSFGITMTSGGLLSFLKSSSAAMGAPGGVTAADMRGAWKVITCIGDAADGTFENRVNSVSGGQTTGITGWPTGTILQLGHFTARNSGNVPKNMGMLPPICFPSAHLPSGVLADIETRVGAMVGLTLP